MWQLGPTPTKFFRGFVFCHTHRDFAAANGQPKKGNGQVAKREKKKRKKKEKGKTVGETETVKHEKRIGEKEEKRAGKKE